VGKESHHPYQIGDLVKCIYDLFEYYEFYWDQMPEKGYPFYGIVIDIQDEALDEGVWGYETLYIVQCFDGYLRYFAYWEMRLVSTSS
tara:strand:+ start:300 stop:560 length:261 start_codon:yes stop_codon:yes gene_type:complete